MKKAAQSTAIALVLTAVLCAQSGITGKWKGTTPNGARIELDLTGAEGALTGTLTREEETTKIAEGKVLDNSFAFKATLGGRTEAFTGELAGDEMTIWLDRQGRDRAVVLKRVK